MRSRVKLCSSWIRPRKKHLLQCVPAQAVVPGPAAVVLAVAQALAADLPAMVRPVVQVAASAVVLLPTAAPLLASVAAQVVVPGLAQVGPGAAAVFHRLTASLEILLTWPKRWDFCLKISA